MENPKKKSKGSKNTKKGWKKTDIADVEEHLEEHRREQRTGGPAAEKSSDALFFIDKIEGENEIKTFVSKKVHKVDSDDDEETYVSQKQRTREKLVAEKKKEEQALERRREANIVNIWGQTNVTVQVDPYLESTVKKDKVKPLSFTEGKCNIEAVEFPDPGASYNPDFDAHQDLLLKAHQAEDKKLKEQKKLNDQVKTLSVEELKKQSEIWLQEMSEGITQEKNNNADSNNEDEEEKVEVNLSKNNSNINRKTLKDKRKEKELKEQEQQKKLLKIEKLKLNDLNRLKTLKRQIRAEEEKSTKRQKLRQKKSEHAMLTRTKTLSKHKYKDPEIVVQLSEDLSATLRELKPEGNLLEDRFKNLQKRNIIETRKKVVPHRKYKRKAVVKRSYKTDTIKDFKPR